MRNTQGGFKWLLVVLLTLSVSIKSWAHTCPSDASDTGVAVLLSAFRINPNGSTGPSIGGGSIGICECIRLRMAINYVAIGPSGGKVAFFQGGSMTIATTSGSFTDNVTPAGGVPLIGNPADPNAGACPGATPSFLSDFTIDYCVRPADLDGAGNVTFLATYVGGLLHFGNDVPGQPTGTTAISVHVDQGPTCSILPARQEVCAGSTATFTASGSGPAGPFTFTWTGPGGFTASGPTITVGVAGTYTATVTDAHGCTSTCTAQLIVNPNPQCVIVPASQTICAGASATFTVNPSGGTPPYTINWTGPGGFTASGPSITINNAQAANAGTYTANVRDSKGCTTSCQAQLIVNPCAPDITVLKEVACLLSGDTCGTFAKVATGVRDSECPAFCYRVTVRNVSPNVPIATLTVTDPVLGGNISSLFGPLPIAPGDFRTAIIKPIVHCVDTPDTVVAEGRSADGLVDVERDSAEARVLNINIVCEISLFSSFDMDGSPNNSSVLLPNGAPVQFTLTLRNTGSSALRVTSLNGVPALVDCTTGVPVVLPTLPFNIAAGGSVTISGCTDVTCPEGASYNVTASAAADDVNGTLCVHDRNGTLITDETSCSASVRCQQPVTCRVTGGGQLIPGFVDQSCIEVNTTIFPFTSPNGLTIKKITHGGQLGAPFSQMDCGAILGNPCIRGQWQHTRHFEGNANPRDVFDMDFHSQTPKGQYDSLSCACLGCCDPVTGAFIPSTLGPLIHKFQICNPDDHKICGPQPRPAPANAIIWSGIGKVTPTDDVRGSRAAQAEWVVFRVYIEDRSEPGGGHPGGAVEPADIYCFQAWKTGIKVSKKPDFTVIATAFRQALGEANCEFLEQLEGGLLPIGSLPSPTVGGVTADIQDCGPMHDGNHQIHPSTGATCTE